MGKKLHRGRGRVFHKRNTRPLKILLWVLAAVIIIPASFFGARYMIEGRPAEDPVSSESSDPSSTNPSGTPTVSEPEQPPTPPSPAGTAVRAFFLPVSALTDTSSLETTLSAAQAAGFNTVWFDLKDSDGWLHYASATELAGQAKSVAADAMSLEALQTAVQTIKSKGFTPLARLYAFEDHQAPRELSAAKIAVEGKPTWTWYDGDPQAGGKPWLNPYSETAHQYLLDLISELKTVGISTVMLDGIRFPARTNKATFGNSPYSAQSKAEVLATFLSKAEDSMGEDGTIWLAAPGNAVLGNDTAGYDGNPLTFGAQGVAPVLMPASFGSSVKVGDTKIADPAATPYETIQAVLAQLNLRLQVMEEAQRPTLLPWLQGYDCTTAAIREQIRAVTETGGTDAGYLLYHPSGTYDFAALAG